MKNNVVEWSLCASLLLVASAPADGAQDARSVLDAATKALGAEGLKTLRYSGSGFDFALGQAPNPTSAWPRFIEKSYLRIVDFDAPASRMQRVRMEGENPPRGGGGGGVFGGGIIFGEQQGEQVITPGSPQARTLADDLMMMLPYGFLRAASKAKDSAVSSRTVGGKTYIVLSFTAPNKALTTGYLNDQYMIERVETKIDNNVLGDIPFETVFSDYQSFGGLKFPKHILQKQAGFPIFDLMVTDVTRNPPTDITSPPERAAPGSGAGSGGISEKLGDGVYLILGGYAAIAVDFKDYIVVLEGPQNDQRAETIMTEARRLIPSKPIKYVVNTHAHFDHCGGLRAFVAEGVTVITQKLNQPYYEKIWANSHSLNPDTLAHNPRKPAFKTVSEKLVLTDGTKVIELYHLRKFAHNDGMIVAYLPKEKVLFEADGFNPPPQPIMETPNPINPYTASLVANIDRLKLDIERIIPVHYPPGGRKVMIVELRTAVGMQK